MALKRLSSLFLLIANIVASPIQSRSSSIKLDVAVKTGSISTAHGLLSKDLSRSKVLFAHGEAKTKGMSSDVPISAIDAGLFYVVDVGVGASTYFLLVDTGSSNTWIGANQTYQPGPNSKYTGENVTVLYGKGGFTGEEFTDDVTIGSAKISGQSFGVASTVVNMSNFDGILGIGPDDLTLNTTSSNGTVLTVTDNLVSQGFIDTALVAVSFAPTNNSLGDTNGELEFGTIDPSKYTGDLTFVPVTSTSPANQYWGFNQSITYGPDAIPILGNSAGILDTGTSFLRIATDAFQAYQQATGAKMNDTAGLLTVADPSTLQSLFFNIGGRTFEFTANAQIWPRALNSWAGAGPELTFLIVSDLGTNSGQGLDFVNGYVFLQRFYSVYDTADSAIGLATTAHTDDTTN